MSNITPNGKVAIITGANSGIGRVTARELALQGYHVFLACRSEDKTQPVLAEIARLSNGKAQAEFLPLDLGNLESVKRCAEQFLARKLPLHVLVCNAGLAGQKGFTQSGFELTFGVCHVGHFLLTNLLLDKLQASAPARVVVVSSQGHRHIKTIDYAALRRPTQGIGGLKEYGVTKLANIYFVRELARRLANTGVTTYALHPGTVASDVWRSVPWPFDRLIKRFMRTVEEGAQTSIYCATSPDLAMQSGLYYEDCRVSEPSLTAQNDAMAAQLWMESERWTSGISL